MINKSLSKLLNYKYIFLLIILLILLVILLLKNKENFYIDNNLFLVNYENFNNFNNNYEIKIKNNKLLNEFKNHFNKCYIINLKDTKIGKKRWSIISKKYPFNKIGNRFNGVYGKEYDYSNEVKNNIIIEKWDFGTWRYNIPEIINMTPSEIGVALSHYNIWKKLENDKIYNKGILVVEDDASKISDSFVEKCNIVMNNVPYDWDIILFGFSCHKGNKGKQINKIIWKVKDFILLHCYLINPKCFKKIKNLLPINAPLDTWLSQKSDVLNIYRHNFISNKNAKNPSSKLIKQRGEDKQNVNTNNFK